MRGRKPIPSVLKLLRGNPGKRRINKAEPVPAGGDPGCPSYLNRAAKLEWKRVLREAPDGLVTKLDRPTLAMYCQNWSRLIELEKIVDEVGYTYNAPGTVVPCARPEMGMIKGLQTLQKGLIAELGFSPSSRSRVTVTPKLPKDTAKGFLFGDRGA